MHIIVKKYVIATQVCVIFYLDCLVPFNLKVDF